MDSSTQTLSLMNKDAITQTQTVEYNDEDCQTDAVCSFSVEVQVEMKAQTMEMGTDPD